MIDLAPSLEPPWSHVLDAQRGGAERSTDADALKLEPSRPARVVGNDDNLARLATGGQHLIQVRRLADGEGQGL